MINISNKKSLNKMMEIELSSLKASLDIQKNLNKQILVFLKNFMGNIEIPVDSSPKKKFYKYLDKSTLALSLSNDNIQYLKTLIKQLQNIKKSLKNNILSADVKAKIKKYNTDFSEQIDSIYKNTSKVEKFIRTISKLDLSALIEELNCEQTVAETSSKEENNSITISSDELNNAYIENTLVISEMQNKIILPYTINNIKEILLNNNEYRSFQEVIDKLYTVSIDNYKVTSIARFKETYKLMTKKEKTSKFKALSLAFELFSNYNLHPAIITACNSLDELDIYLACLEDNTLEDFNFFDIKYEIAPTIAMEPNKADRY